MGYGDNRYGDRGRQGGSNDQWRDLTDGDRWQGERGSYGDRGSDRDRSGGGNWGGSSRGGGNDRGFIERAGEQVRSWFGDDDDRRGGGRGYEQGRQGGGWTGSDRGSESFGGGFGNQRGWGDDHFDRQTSYGDREGRGGYERGQTGGYERGQSGEYDRSRGRSEWGGGRDDDRQGYAGGATGSSWGGGPGADTWGGSGYGGGNDSGRRFDRIDPGHVGAQGSHPMSAPVGGAYGAGFGPAAGSMGGSAARSAAIMRQGGGHHLDTQALLGGQSGSQSGQRSYGGGVHDHHYSEWRQRQISQLDQDYDEYRREHQSRFEQEFGGWREKRQTQRQHLGRVTEHMEVVGSDGQHIGTVDKVRGDRVILTKSDQSAGGVHHSIPCSWIESVDEKVTVNKTAEEAMTSWQNEEENRAFFDGDRGAGSQGSEGPHMLNRSFSGTYSDRDR